MTPALLLCCGPTLNELRSTIKQFQLDLGLTLDGLWINLFEQSTKG